MSKGIYVGVDNKARKVKKAFVGVDDVARKVKKGYIGVGGVARPFFSSEPGVSYYGTVGVLNGGNTGVGTNLPNYALFSVKHDPYEGGTSVPDPYAIVYAYDPALASQFVEVDYELDAAASVGDYALFAPWFDGAFAIDGIEAEYRDTFVLDKDMTQMAAPMFTYGLSSRASESNGKYAIFYGGDWGNGFSSSIEAFDGSLTKTSMRMSGYEDDDDGYAGAASARNGKYAIFGGGEPAYDHRVVAIDENLHQTLMSPLEGYGESRWGVIAVTVGRYTLFIGGVAEYLGGTTDYMYPLVDIIDIYDDCLMKLTLQALDVPRDSAGAAELNGIALIAGGWVDGYDEQWGDTSVPDRSVLTFTEDLVRGVADDLVASSGGVTAVETIGSYAIVIGEDPASYKQAQTDVYTVL